MNWPWGHCAKSSKPDRERQILYDLTYVKRKKLTETENRLVVVKGKAGGERLGEGGPKVQTSGTRWLSPGDVMYSMVTIVNNTVLYFSKLLRE